MSDFRDRAACRDADPEIFFPVGERGPADAHTAAARMVCRRCVVVEQCLSWALTTGQDDGVWGGMSAGERRALRRHTSHDHAGLTGSEQI